MQPKRIYLYGIDPGSGKAWDVYSSCFDVCSKQLVEQPVYTQWGRIDLDRAIQSILTKAKEPYTATMVAIDVPVVTPQDFMPSYICDDSRHYPFNVEPFTIRPCECALRSHPSVVDASLAHQKLVSLVGKLCGWVQPFKSSTNIPFQKLPSCKGVSVMIFSEAPHQPLMKVFRTTLQSDAGSDVTVTTAPAKGDDLKSAHLYLLESHPAVAMGFWMADGCLGNLTTLPQYKGTLRETDKPPKGTKAEEKQRNKERKARIQDNFDALARQVADLAKDRYALAPNPAITSNDQLDAFVGFVNLLDLLTDRGDWFGTADSGYFLVPRLAMLEGQIFSKAWQEAELKVREANQRESDGA